MFKYRKKPVVIEAVQHFSDMGTRTAAIPQWLIEAISKGVVFCVGGQTYQQSSTYIRTVEGDILVNDGDYIIQGVKGELYPCKPEIFEATYEVVK